MGNTKEVQNTNFTKKKNCFKKYLLKNVVL